MQIEIETSTEMNNCDRLNSLYVELFCRRYGIGLRKNQAKTPRRTAKEIVDEAIYIQPETSPSVTNKDTRTTFLINISYRQLKSAEELRYQKAYDQAGKHLSPAYRGYRWVARHRGYAPALYRLYLMTRPMSGYPQFISSQIRARKYCELAAVQGNKAAIEQAADFLKEGWAGIQDPALAEYYLATLAQHDKPGLMEQSVVAASSTSPSKIEAHTSTKTESPWRTLVDLPPASDPMFHEVCLALGKYHAREASEDPEQFATSGLASQAKYFQALMADQGNNHIQAAGAGLSSSPSSSASTIIGQLQQNGVNDPSLEQPEKRGHNTKKNSTAAVQHSLKLNKLTNLNYRHLQAH